MCRQLIRPIVFFSYTHPHIHVMRIIPPYLSTIRSLRIGTPRYTHFAVSRSSPACMRAERKQPPDRWERGGPRAARAYRTNSREFCRGARYIGIYYANCGSHDWPMTSALYVCMYTHSPSLGRSVSESNFILMGDISVSACEPRALYYVNRAAFFLGGGEGARRVFSVFRGARASVYGGLRLIGRLMIRAGLRSAGYFCCRVISGCVINSVHGWAEGWFCCLPSFFTDSKTCFRANETGTPIRMFSEHFFWRQNSILLTHKLVLWLMNIIFVCFR